MARKAIRFLARTPATPTLADGSVSEPSFGDMGLRPATTYGYKVTVILSSGTEGPSSKVVTATYTAGAARM